MTTITVEVNEDKSLLAIKEFVTRLALKHHIKNEGLLYTDEIKSELDKRYSDYLAGIIGLISSEESRERIHALFADKS